MASSTLTTPSMFQLDEYNNKEVDKLTYEIFSILENNFLFGYDNTKLPSKEHEHIMSTPCPNKYATNNGKVRILSIDAGGATNGVLAAKSLAHLEATLRSKSGNKNAHIADFFDVVSGAGAGGILASLLFTRGKDGNPMFTAENALKFILENGRKFSTPAGFFRRTHLKEKIFKNLFGELTLKDTIKSVLIPCYDLVTGAPFLFSRADALEMDGCDFKMSDVCGATMADRTVEMKSIDGRRKIMAVGGGVAMNNPTAAAITHVVNNKHEFPLCKGVEDLLVVSLGNGETSSLMRNIQHSSGTFVKIIGDGVADMVDQAVSMAFGQSCSNNYVRIQGNGVIQSKKHNIKDNKMDLLTIAGEMLKQKNVESLLFKGKRLAQSTNLDKLENIANELIMEQESRKTSILPPVVLKQASSSPRTSSATTLSTSSSY
ncbi:hypothetical protein Leryth_015369 [Lithospermum erythrorhizon]|nr:hypothetical protein Leryth_015369 [Lithospermum erythrorhizon]